MISNTPDAPAPHSEPVRDPGRASGLRRTIIAIVLIAIVVIGIIGYALAGFAYTTARVANADKSLNAVISHQNSLNSTFKDIDTKFSGLNSSSTYDAAQARTLFDQFVANAKSAGATVDQDDISLVSARASLNEQQWLAVFSRTSLDKEAARIDHARKGLSIAKTIAADYVQDGLFLQAFLDVATDLTTLGTQSANADLVGAKATLTSMKTHVDKALQLSTAPGLPSELHNLMVDFGTLTTDYGKLLDAAATGDNATITSAYSRLETDANKISTYDTTKIATEIDTFYKPLVDSFNAEMAQATA